MSVVDRLFGGGGGERVAAQLVEHLDAARFDRMLCVTRPSSAPLLDELRAAGVRVLALDRSAQFDLGAWRPLLRLLRAKQVDVLHSHKFGSNVWCSVLARLAAVPVLVTHEHSWSFKDDRVRIMLDRRLVAPVASAMIAVSAEDARRMIEVEGIPHWKIRVIPNGIAVVDGLDSGLLRRELRLDDRTLIVGMIASLRPEKRVDLVLDAAKLLVEDDRLFHVVIIGDGPLREDLQARAELLGIARRVSFLGYRDDARELAGAFDVAVLSSDREGTPLSLLEYMALARAIVATSVGGIPDVVAHEREALLVPPGEAGELAGAIERLLAAPEERARLGSAAAARQRKEYDIVATTRRLEDLYLELLGARRQTR